MQWIAVAVGAFYVFAGIVVLRRMAMDRMLDIALEAITLKKTEAKERLKSRVLTFGGCLTFASGLALMMLSPWATVFFAANAILQGGYLLWAWKALPPESEDEKKGRQQTINAFFIYMAAFAFVAHAHSQGVFSHWPIAFSTFSWLIEPLVISVVTAGLWANWFLRMPRRGTSVGWSRADDGGADTWDDLPTPPRPERLRLAPEYACWPTWDDETGENIDPANLELSDALYARIREWDDTWQATYKPDDPVNSGFDNEEASERWIAEGEAIAAALAEEWTGQIVVKPWPTSS